MSEKLDRVRKYLSRKLCETVEEIGLDHQNTEEYEHCLLCDRRFRAGEGILALRFEEPHTVHCVCLDLAACARSCVQREDEKRARREKMERELEAVVTLPPAEGDAE